MLLYVPVGSRNTHTMYVPYCSGYHPTVHLSTIKQFVPSFPFGVEYPPNFPMSRQYSAFAVRRHHDQDERYSLRYAAHNLGLIPKNDG